MNLNLLVVMGRTLMLLAFGASGAACGRAQTSPNGSDDGGADATVDASGAVGKDDADSHDASDSETAGDVGVKEGFTSFCLPDPSQRLVCDRSKLDGVPWGPLVTVKQGTGSAPVPQGGTVVPGFYQLVSETVYGNVPPNTSATGVGETERRILHVQDDTTNELYVSGESLDEVSHAGNTCDRLVARSLEVLEVSGLMSYSGECIPDSRDKVSYTFKGEQLTLIRLRPYFDRARGISILGSYTTVYDFVPASDNGPDITIAEDGDISPLATPTERDPRCPATPPEPGDPCSPDPAPLECEYGGDSFGRCTTFAECVLDLDLLDGTYHYQLDSATDCTPPNPGECPSTSEAAVELAEREVDADAGVALFLSDAGILDAGTISAGLVCNYPDGLCACEPVQLLSGASGCIWTCRSGTALTAEGTTTACPWPRPLAGDPCQPGLLCEYDDLPCGGKLSFGPSMICQSGYWAQVGCVR